MSTVLVDAGNARLKWTVLLSADADGIRIADVHTVELRGNVERALETFAAALPGSVDTVVVGNVAGREFGERLTRTLRSGPLATVWFARSLSVSCGVRNAYPQPHSLGVDRWAAIVAGFRRAGAIAVGESICVVDAGTALTIDLIDAAGRHLGGLILPGLRLQQEALLDAAADIALPPTESVSRPQGLDVFAASTADALARSGRFACAAAVDRCVRIVSESAGEVRVLLTGGDAAVLAPWLETRAEICPNLVFEGLAMLFAEGKSD